MIKVHNPPKMQIIPPNVVYELQLKNGLLILVMLNYAKVPCRGPTWIGTIVATLNVLYPMHNHLRERLLDICVYLLNLIIIFQRFLLQTANSTIKNNEFPFIFVEAKNKNIQCSMTDVYHRVNLHLQFDNLLKCVQVVKDGPFLSTIIK